MKISKADFIKSATEPKGFPKTGMPQFAFIGRSNCGKSSLINMLVNRKNLVKTGSKPGMTKLVNFFNINDEFVLVDLPGFGFAEAPSAVRKTFMPMMKDFFAHAEKLKGVFMLVDSRRTPGEEEFDLITHLSENGIPTIIVATKCDKLTPREKKEAIERIADTLEVETDCIFTTSSKNKSGRREVLSLIASLI